MRISKLTILLVLGALPVLASACSSAPAQTPPPARAATQTPWIIFVPVTSTPEPATVTPLPTVTAAQPTKAPTRAVVRATATKAPTAAPVAVAPTVTPAPACSLGTVGSPFFPGDGAPQHTRGDGGGGDAIIFKWQPPASLSGQGDSHVGYAIQIESRRGAQLVNSTTLYVSANKYLQDGKVTLDGRSVSRLAAGDNATVIWNVTIVRSSSDFNDTDLIFHPAGLINCGAPSQNLSIQLMITPGTG